MKQEVSMRLLLVFLVSSCAAPESTQSDPWPPLVDEADGEPWEFGDLLEHPYDDPVRLPVDPSQTDLATLADPGPDGASVSVHRHPAHPLLAVVDLNCDGECVTTVSVEGPGVAGRRLPTMVGEGAHRIVVPGLREFAVYDLTVHVLAPSGRTLTSAHTITTGELGFSPPAMTVTHPGELGGALLVAYSFGDEHTSESRFLALDADAAVVWFYRWPMHPSLPPQIRPRPDGTFLVHANTESRIIDVEGNVLARWRQGITKDGWHHDVDETGDGHLLVLADEHVPGRLKGEDVTLLSDTVLEYDEDGTIVQRWSAADTLDTSRFPGPLSTSGGVHLDWSHGNAVSTTPDGDGYVVSLRHQHWVVRVDRATAEVDWILGEGGDFALLEGTWFDAQHDPTFINDTELFVYDNGTERHDFFGGSGTRVVKYMIDEDHMEAWQTWSWELPVYTPFIGGVQPLDEGAVLVAAGGQVDGTGDIYRVSADGGVEWSIEVEAMLFRAELMTSW